MGLYWFYMVFIRFDMVFIRFDIGFKALYCSSAILFGFYTKVLYKCDRFYIVLMRFYTVFIICVKVYMIFIGFYIVLHFCI
jgi:hypothetical protein